MEKVQIRRFENAKEIAVSAAEDFVRLVGRAEPLHVAVSGGRMGAEFFKALTALVKRAGADIGGVHFFWADERCVSPSDPESNFGMAERWLFKPLVVTTSQVHRIPGELEPVQAARIASVEIRRIVPIDSAGQPVLDLVLLGMGEDGHVASLFPGEAREQMESSEIFRAVVGPKPPPRRVTIGYPALCVARKVWALVSGKGKEAAFRKSLEPESGTPFGRVLRMRTETAVLTDLS